MGAEELESAPVVSRASAQRLAEAGVELLRSLHETQAALREREAELAAADAAPLTPDPATGVQGGKALADVLEATLGDLCQLASGCRAGLYMLDGSTSELKLRATSGWHADALVAAPRGLRGSLPDLEALVGNVVEVSETPAALGADVAGLPALCVAVQVADTPVGVLWLWSEAPRQWQAADHVAMRMSSRVIAHELTADLQHERAGKARKVVGPLRTATQWQHTQHPPVHHLASGWSADGWVATDGALANTWYHWDVLPDGMLSIVLAEAHATGYAGAMIAATARAAWQAHAGYRHDPAQMLQRISDTLWNTNTAEQRLSIAYAQIDPTTGQMQLASAGQLEGLIASRYGVRPLLYRSDPLGESIEARPQLRQHRLAAGELMISCTPGLVSSGPVGGGQVALSQQQLTELIGPEDHREPQRLLARIRRAAAELGPMHGDRAALVLGRSQVD